MGRLKFLPLIFLLLPLLQAEEKTRSVLFPDAVSLESRLYSEIYSEEGESASLWDLTLMPTLHFHTENRMEIAPYLLFRIEMESNEEGVVDTSTVATELNRLSLGVGTGFYWNLIDTNYIDLISGFRPEAMVMFPQWGSSSPTGTVEWDPGYGSFVGMVDIPVGLEVNPIERLSIRVWVEMLRIGFRVDEEYFEDNSLNRYITCFSYSPFWDSDWTPDTYEDWIPYATPISFSLIWSL
jgi:hypothetical protein